MQALAPLLPTHHLPQIKLNGLPRRVVQTMVGHKRAEARFHPPYKMQSFKNEVNMAEIDKLAYKQYLGEMNFAASLRQDEPAERLT